ncbi:MAG: aminotransferase class I/II-fold pyridoxal phosphate-dependent enzyme [Dysgonamonadaceae bacterium]|jgi:dTDP-4-amino-4,6-dideoxygalactose transaminase|nr:aminotransferase class I/II-fold pyridoxal phosphate-dependent enzyme [Dysgonamonadaceae bacterium]
MYRIWISPPHLSGKEMEYIADAFRKNWITTQGDNVTGFEQDIQSYLGETTEAVVVNSGTSALHLALMLLDVKKNDNVICQDFTFAATVNPIVYLGAKPVLVDSEKQTWNISPAFLEKAVQDCIQKGKKPKVIIWVNLYGMPAQIREIREIAQKYDIALLEDAAESFGSSYQGKKCGTFGDISVFSFNGNKIITTSGGGALLSADKNHIRKARSLASQARDEAHWYQHSRIGYNYGMSNIIAGIGRGQMTALEDRVEARRHNHRFYKEAFAGIAGVTVHQEPDKHYLSNHWLSCLLIEPELTGGIDCGILREKLTEAGIEARFLWKPMHLQPVFKKCPFYGDGTSENLFRKGLCLPSGSNLTEKERNEIAQVIKNILSRE